MHTWCDGGATLGFRWCLQSTGTENILSSLFHRPVGKTHLVYEPGEGAARALGIRLWAVIATYRGRGSSLQPPRCCRRDGRPQAAGRPPWPSAAPAAANGGWGCPGGEVAAAAAVGTPPQRRPPRPPTAACSAGGQKTEPLRPERTGEGRSTPSWHGRHHQGPGDPVGESETRGKTTGKGPHGEEWATPPHDTV